MWTATAGLSMHTTTSVPSRTIYLPQLSMVWTIDFKDNLLFLRGSYGHCDVGLQNNLVGAGVPGITLGLPFLRSVYVYVWLLGAPTCTTAKILICSAYRFPTGDCPGYYGFAFPSGANRTQSQISQKPTSTLSSSQCLSLIKPTSAPSFTPFISKNGISHGSYEVYGWPTVP